MHTVADAFEAAYAKETSAGAQEAGDASGAGEVSLDSRAGEGLPSEEGPRRRKLPAGLDAPLIRALWVLYKGRFLSAGVIRFANTSVQFLPAILVQRLLR